MSLFRPLITLAQNRYLAAHYATASKVELLAMFPGCSWTRILQLGSRIGSTTQTARRPYTPRLWSATADAYLRVHYPTAGAKAVAAHLGLTAIQTTCRARYLQVRHLNAAKPAKAAAPAPRRLTPKVALPLLTPVKLRPSLRNLNATKETRKKAERAAIESVGITADAIRKMDYRDPARMAYMLGGVAGWQQWKSQQAA